MTDDASLIDRAAAVRRFAHAPYSGFRVGAAIVDEGGRVHVGCNVENAAYPDGICAEGGAIGAMIAGGGTRIVAIAVVGGVDAPVACTPCGTCRQRIREFADAATRIVVTGDDGVPCVYTIDALLPASFGPGTLTSGAA